jgi:hypothetical protein
MKKLIIAIGVILAVLLAGYISLKIAINQPDTEFRVSLYDLTHMPRCPQLDCQCLHSQSIKREEAVPVAKRYLLSVNPEEPLASVARDFIKMCEIEQELWIKYPCGSSGDTPGRLHIVEQLNEAGQQLTIDLREFCKTHHCQK